MIMRWIRTGLLLVAFAAASVATPASAGDEETRYRIKLDRPVQVGQQFELRGECMLNQVTSGTIMGSEVPRQTTRYVLRIDSAMEIKAVDDRGRPSETTHVMRECAITKDGEVVRTYEAGTRMIAVRRDGDNLIEVDGVPVIDETRGLLDIVSCVEHGGPTAGDLCGPDEPRRIGESWPIDREVAHADFQRQTGTPLQPEQISGQTKLLEAVDHGGEPCLKVLTEMMLDDGLLGIDGLPPGSRLEEASTSIKFQGLYPRDQTTIWRSRSMQIDFHMVMVQPDSGTLRSDTSIVANLKLAPAGTTGIATVPAGSEAAGSRD